MNDDFPHDNKISFALNQLSPVHAASHRNIHTINRNISIQVGRNLRELNSVKNIDSMGGCNQVRSMSKIESISKLSSFLPRDQVEPLVQVHYKKNNMLSTPKADIQRLMFPYEHVNNEKAFDSKQSAVISRTDKQATAANN